MKPRGKPSQPTRSMIVAGLMSGTSADGVDVALVRIGQGRDGVKLKLLSHSGFPFPSPLRRAVLAAMNAPAIPTAELARLNWRLGIAYQEALHGALQAHPCKLDLVGCHGQTIYHQAAAAPYLGRRVACTWQIGEMALVAAEAGVPVVSNFRPADMVAGGQGAPLVPLLDYALFRHSKRGRVLQNLGGIGNLTALFPGSGVDDVLAFDTGPANMVTDTVTDSLFHKRYDRNGRIAARGRVIESVLASALQMPFFSAAPPRSAGREQFGAEFVRAFLRDCRKASSRPEDAVATATALTASSVALAYRKFVQPRMATAKVDYVLSGGGARNTTLVKMLRDRLTPLGCTVLLSDDLGLPTQAKEAAAFALLAWQTWHHLPGNVPSATGAQRPAILGEITYV